MFKKTTSIIQRNSFWLALFCHCFLFSGISFVWTASPTLLKQEEDRPSLFIPSYVYHTDAASPMQQLAMPPSPSSKLPERTSVIETPNRVPISKRGLEKPMITQAPVSLNSSHPIDISRSAETEPVHLIGDKNIDRPLLTLLGKALTKHLVYPKSAIDLNVKGTSVIGFLLYPDGHITDVQLLRTSRAEILDKAAVRAANAIGSVNQVSQYLAKPKFMIIGIIFE